MERLSDPEDVIGYLEVSLEEYLDDGDKAFFLKGIKNVIEAQGGILSVSEQAGIDLGFLSQEEEIEKDFGNKLEWWARARSEKRVAFRNQDADPTDEKDWHNQHEWLVDMLEKFYAVFHPRLEKLMMGV